MNYRNLLIKSGIILVCWIFLALLYTPQIYIMSQQWQEPLTLWQAFSSRLILFCSWLFSIPLILWLGYALPFEKPHRWRNLAIIFALSFPLSLLNIFFYQQMPLLLSRWFAWLREPIPFRNILIGSGATTVMFYWGIFAASQAEIYFRRY